MADTRPDSQHNVVVYDVNRKPSYELTAPEIGYPIEASQRGRTVHLHIYLKPYKSSDLKSALMDSAPLFTDQGRSEAEMTTNEASIQRFVKSHFVRLGNIVDRNGEEVPHEAGVRLLEANPAFLTRAWRFGVCGINTVEQEDELETLGDFVVLDLDEEVSAHEVETELKVLDGEGEIAHIFLKHTLTKESEKDRREYSSAQRTRVRTKDEGGWRVVVNQDVLEVLYNRHVCRLDGALVNRQLCTEENKKDWVHLVPMFWKTLVINEIYRGLAIKNA